MLVNGDAQGYLVRYADWELDELLPYVSAIAIDGAKNVGKTATAQRRADRELLLDREETIQFLRADAEGVISVASVPGQTLLVDEWQLYPTVWNIIRR